MSNLAKFVIALFLSSILSTIAVAQENKGIRISGKPPNRERVVYVYDEATKKWVQKAGSVKTPKQVTASRSGSANSTGYPKPVKNASNKPTVKSTVKSTVKPTVKPVKKTAKALAPAKHKSTRKAAIKPPKPRPVPLSSPAVVSNPTNNKTFDAKMAGVATSVDPKYLPQTVKFRTREKTGTIVVDTDQRFLYLVLGWGKARRYGVGVGKDALSWSGSAKIGKKAEWPKWTPTNEMITREPAKFAKYKNGMPGGLKNPLGARALYLHQGRNDTYFRIHGTTAPESIGTASSNGCIRMINEHVIDLYERVPVGTKVVVLKSDPSKILQ